jgi:cathepsin D
LGTPAQKINVLFDTGSNYFWLPGSGCITNCTGHNIFRSTKSSSYFSLNIPFSMSYVAAQIVSGVQAIDNVNIGGLMVYDQIFGEATRAAQIFDGIFGLQYTYHRNVPSPMLNIIQEGALQKNLFGFWLNPDVGGEISIGSTNTNRYNPNHVNWANILTPGRWSLPLHSATFGGTALSFSHSPR